MSFNIIVKRYSHYNRSLGKHIRSKKHYEEEMKKGGYVSYEKGQEQVKKWEKDHRKDYKGMSPAARAINQYARQIKDKKGNVKLGGRAIKAMEDLGVNFGRKPDATN